MIIDKKKWFDVPDSLTRDSDEGEPYYNVQAKFADHPILNVAKSKAARHNVYDLGIVLHTKVLRVQDGKIAEKNGSSHVMRFDKGEDARVPSMRPGPEGNPVLHYDGAPGMGKEAFEAAIRDIRRCWDAWQFYQLFRKAPVHPLEAKALEIITSMPKPGSGKIIVDDGGVLKAVEVDDGEEKDLEEQPDLVEVDAETAAKAERILAKNPARSVRKSRNKAA